MDEATVDGWPNNGGTTASGRPSTTFRRAGCVLDTETESRWFADVRELEAALEPGDGLTEPALVATG